ncbi:hypothetical protein GCM10020216_043480 [Nonomuraea helvata]
MIGGGTLMIVVTTLLGLALGAILRNGVVASAALVAVVLLLPFVATVLPWGKEINRFLPTYPALQLIEQLPDTMPTWAAFTVLAGWAVVPLLIGVIVQRLLANRGGAD